MISKNKNNYTLTNGSLYISADDEVISMSDVDISTVVYHMSASEDMPVSLTLMPSTGEATFHSCVLFDEVFDPFAYKTTTLSWEMPIHIQARWHKKKRIRKKWLKRYGMKSDTITIKGDTNMLEYMPSYEVDDDTNLITCRHDSYEFNIEPGSLEFILRPDQMRRGIEIEW